MMTRKMTSVMVAGLLAGLASSASATLLPVNSAILAPGSAGPTGGTIISNSGVLPITSATFTGTVTSKVIVNDPSNPFGSGQGFLTFTYLIHNDAGSIDGIDRFTVSSFAGVGTDVSYQTPAGAGIIPTSVDRSLAGDTIGFSFSQLPLGLGVITQNNSSALLVIQTNAKGSTETTAFAIDGSTAAVSSFAPAAGVPEPASLSLAALGGAALLFRRRRSV